VHDVTAVVAYRTIAELECALTEQLFGFGSARRLRSEVGHPIATDDSSTKRIELSTPRASKPAASRTFDIAPTSDGHRRFRSLRA